MISLILAVLIVVVVGLSGGAMLIGSHMTWYKTGKTPCLRTYACSGCNKIIEEYMTSSKSDSIVWDLCDACRRDVQKESDNWMDYYTSGNGWTIIYKADKEV